MKYHFQRILYRSHHRRWDSSICLFSLEVLVQWSWSCHSLETLEQVKEEAGCRWVVWEPSITWGRNNRKLYSPRWFRKTKYRSLGDKMDAFEIKSQILIGRICQLYSSLKQRLDIRWIRIEFHKHRRTCTRAIGFTEDGSGPEGWGLFSTTLNATFVDEFQFQEPSFSVMLVMLAVAIKFMASCLQMMVSFNASELEVILVNSASPCMKPVILEWYESSAGSSKPPLMLNASSSGANVTSVSGYGQYLVKWKKIPGNETHHGEIRLGPVHPRGVIW